MTAEPTASYAPDQRADAVLAEYLQAVQAGHAPDRKEWLARHPELAADLEAFLADDAVVREMAAPFRPTPHAAVVDTAVLPALPISQRFGDYEILQEFARSGMGIVYKARQLSLDRIVALKMVQPGGRSPADLEGFLHTEARAVASLDHPHIVPVYDFGVYEGRPFLSMKLMESGSLDKHLSRFRNDHRASARLVATAARAVHHAHQRGLLHRDLKPANILLDAQGQPHVTDFGLAKRVSDETTASQAGAIVGTPAYMAPEQAAAEPVLTTGADVYGLGAILYALLTGQPPFRGTNVIDTLDLVRSQEPAPPRSLNSKADPDLETICLKCLEKAPAKRYGSAEALADDLERWLAGEPIRARRSAAWERMIKWLKKRPAIAALCGAIAVVSALGIGGIIWQWQNAESAQRVATDKANKAELAQKEEADARRKEMELRKELQKLLVRERVSLAHQSVRLAYQYWRDNKVGAAERSLDASPSELRHWEWHYLKRLFHAELLALVHRNSVFDVAHSPDGKRIATTSGPDVTIWDAATGDQLLQVSAGPEDGQTTGLCYSPDGKRLAVAGGNLQGSRSRDNKNEAAGFVRILDADTGKEILALRKFSAMVFGVAFSPDGNRLATAGTYTGKSDELRIWDAASGQELFTLDGHTGTVWQVAFSPNGDYLASTSGDGTARLWDAVAGKEVHLLRGQREAAVGVAFSPDSKRLATTYGSGHQTGQKARKPAEVRIWDVSTGALILSFRANEGMIPRIAFSPNGDRLATSGWDRTAKLWDAKTVDELMTFRGHREIVDIDYGAGRGRTVAWGANIGWVVGMAFSPDGKRLATAGTDYTVRVWDITHEQDRIQFESAHERDILGFKNNGKQLIARIENRLNIRDAKTGQFLSSVVLPETLHRPVLSVDGHRIAGIVGEKAKIWDTTTGKQLVTSLGGLVTALSSDGKYLATAITEEQSAGVESSSIVKLCDATTGEELITLQREDDGNILFLQFSRDGNRLVSCSYNGSLRVWDMRGNRELGHFETDLKMTTFLALSPDGTQLAGITNSQPDLTVTVYDLSTGKEIHKLTHSGEGASPLGYSPDGKRLATSVQHDGGSPGDIKLWDMETGQEVMSLPKQDRIDSLMFSPDSHRLIASSPSGITIWDATPLEKRKSN